MYYEAPLMDFIHVWPDGRYKSKDFISTDPTPGDNLVVKVIEFSLKSQNFCVTVYIAISSRPFEEFHLYFT